MPPLRIAAVGDIMLGESPQVFGFGVRSSIEKHKARFLFDEVRSLLSGADLTIANLEAVVAPLADDARFGDRLYRGAPESIPDLKAAGIDVVSVCTNHMMQHGDEAFAYCVQRLQAAGLAVAGAACPAHEIERTVLLERQGQRVQILSYNFRPIQYHTAPPAWPSPTKELILSEISRVRREADVVLVTLHWGDEFIEYPSPSQVELAHALVDGGADIIIGHHPHIVQGVEDYRGAVIAYSLGNFVFDQWQPRLRRSMILNLVVRGPGRIEYSIEPIVIDAMCRPVPCIGERRERELQHHAALSNLIGKHTEVAYKNELGRQYRRFRREVMTHYATKFWKFKARDYVANIAEMVRRRA